jgi:hypothetical protein
MSVFNIGDRVRIVRKVIHEYGWDNTWNPSMTDYVGNSIVYTVRRITNFGIRLEEIPFYSWPEGALEFVDDGPTESPICRKIRQMQENRLKLGYKY